MDPMGMIVIITIMTPGMGFRLFNNGSSYPSADNNDSDNWDIMIMIVIIGGYNWENLITGKYGGYNVMIIGIS